MRISAVKDALLQRQGVRGSFHPPMAVYLLLCVPLVYLVLVALIADGEVWFNAEDSRFTVTPAVKGALWYAPAIVLILISESVLPLRYDTSRIFLYHVVHESGIPIVVGLAGALLVSWRMERESDLRLLVAMTSVLAGFYTVAGIVDLLREARFLDPYTIAILPTMRAAAVAALPLLITAWRRESKGIRHLYLILLLAMPFLLGLPGFIHALNRDVAAYVIAAAIAAVVGVGCVALFRAAFPVRVSGPGETAARAGVDAEGGDGTGSFEPSSESDSDASFSQNT